MGIRITNFYEYVKNFKDDIPVKCGDIDGSRFAIDVYELPNTNTPVKHICDSYDPYSDVTIVTPQSNVDGQFYIEVVDQACDFFKRSQAVNLRDFNNSKVCRYTRVLSSESSSGGGSSSSRDDDAVIPASSVRHLNHNNP